MKRLEPLCRKWVALGGGGYNLENVPRGWCLAWAIMNDYEVPDKMPEAIRSAWEPRGYRLSRIRDDPFLPDVATREQAWRYAREQVHRLQRLVFPHHGI